MNNLRNQCSPDGFEAFEKTLNACGKMIEARGDNKIPKMTIRNGEISIDGGPTRSEIEAEYKKNNPKVSSCISYNDIVEIDCFINEIPRGSKGRVIEVYCPFSGTNVINFLVEIPIYTSTKELVTVFTEVIPDEFLKLRKRWDREKKKYLEEELEKPVITFNDYSESYYNEYKEHRFN